MNKFEHWSAQQYQEYIKKSRKDTNNKFHNQTAGITHDSLKEENRSAELHLLERKGIIRNLQEQVRFTLIESQSGEYRKERPVAYIADFVFEEQLADGSWKKIVEDTKGHKTKDYIIKRKLMLSVYGISIREV